MYYPPLREVLMAMHIQPSPKWRPLVTGLEIVQHLTMMQINAMQAVGLEMLFSHRDKKVNDLQRKSHEILSALVALRSEVKAMQDKPDKPDAKPFADSEEYARGVAMLLRLAKDYPAERLQTLLNGMSEEELNVLTRFLGRLGDAATLDT